jgi:hypothetical protein
MDASSVKTPESVKATDRSVEQPAEESGSDAQQLAGDKVLLVEDNAINMRVRQSHFRVSRNHPLNNIAESILTTFSPVVNGSHEEARLAVR